MEKRKQPTQNKKGERDTMEREKRNPADSDKRPMRGGKVTIWSLTASHRPGPTTSSSSSSHLLSVAPSRSQSLSRPHARPKCRPVAPRPVSVAVTTPASRRPLPPALFGTRARDVIRLICWKNAASS
ncbi:hypothetical protein ASPZODRAFT_1208966 [Penicilliopsis zonata CBS 506.65]|uniref:Uncharacterized protein n=1 Tax=Penicilliopsis zonata CBS 506.65 TaxID=1073090 RepID=A0A1L9S7A3_9EURO|nr:hypothetical protein ASPZODRAFT_1208966 [Penicilliopsis zonata CBS 506.65]OJJ43057.1 hypothetical protein ASPZODRAFT_1208966 [Penicilliopsis zonata CBS 506.65]